MAKVVIYTTQYCPFCVRAKHILESKGASYEEFAVDNDPQLRQEMTEKAGGSRTVPQIWINEQHIGGCSELMTLDGQGGLEPLLAQ